jgi:hypothetical protein
MKSFLSLAVPSVVNAAALVMPPPMPSAWPSIDQSKVISGSLLVLIRFLLSPTPSLQMLLRTFNQLCLPPRSQSKPQTILLRLG